MAHDIPQLTLAEAWATLEQDQDAVLVDVRTTAEWNLVGIPDLGDHPNELRFVEWNRLDGTRNEQFIEQATQDVDHARVLLLLCRSGVRSQAAAEELQAHGWRDVHNIAPGFEGPLDEQRHRHGGWKDALPWVQG